MSTTTQKRAKPSQKKAAPAALPTWQQTMELALASAQLSMEELVRIRVGDEDWIEDDVDVDFAVNLALGHIKRLRADPPTGPGRFDREWFQAAAVINLSVATFSRQNCCFFRHLEYVKKQFEVLAEAVDFVAREACDAN